MSESETPKLTDPWLVAVWPGMGNVALTAGYYLMSKLGMHVVAEYDAGDLIDIDHVEVKDGILSTGRRPRNRFFLWQDPEGKHDLVVFLGEAQPPIGKYRFCDQIVQYARQLGIQRVFTFAAMATQMDPRRSSQVFVAATDRETLDELNRPELIPLENGNIGGLNGVLLGAAADVGMRGACFLGEMPHVFVQFPFPKASLAILDVFKDLCSIDLDVSELTEQVATMDEQLGELLSRVETTFEEQEGVSEGVAEEEFVPEPTEEQRLSAIEEQRIEALFEQAERDRSKAFELKQELDRLGVFKLYEDRFLDLFKKSD